MRPKVGSHLLCTGYTGLDYKAVPRFGDLVTAVAFHFCLNLPAAFPQPGNSLIVQPCTCIRNGYFLRMFSLFAGKHRPTHRCKKSHNIIESCCHLIRHPFANTGPLQADKYFLCIKKYSWQIVLTAVAASLNVTKYVKQLM